MALKIKNAKKLHEKSKTHKVNRTGKTTFDVLSGNSGETYKLSQSPSGGFYCNCPWGWKRGLMTKSGCSHVQSVISFVEAEKERTTSAWANPIDAARQHRPIIDTLDGALITSRK